MSSTNFAIIINGKPRGKILAPVSIRQGGPVSHFLFILVAARFVRMMTQAAQNNLINGFPIGNCHIHYLQADILQKGFPIVLFTSTIYNFHFSRIQVPQEG